MTINAKRERVMPYIISTNFLGEIISYDLVEGAFLNAEVNRCYDSKDRFDLLVQQETALREHSDFMCITIATTDACNLRCKYCFEKHDTNHLTKESISSICDLIARYKEITPALSKVVVIWFGGEPLLNLGYIIDATERIAKLTRRLGLVYSGRLITNGVELDRIIPYIQQLYLTDIQITLDGIKKIYDSRRVRISGEGSFDRIIGNILKIDTEVDLVLRVNIDRDNITNCIELYDYISALGLNKDVKVYFQPMLVENYGHKSASCNNLISYDIDLNEKYLDALEYTESLDFPRYIGAFCNVDFSGSLLIKANGQLCKCWVDVADYTELQSEQALTISDTDKIIAFMKSPSQARRDARCMICDIYPTCLGGCKYKKYTLDECERKKRNVVSTISRLYLKEWASKKLFYAILSNEIIWFRNIGCEVRYKDNGIEVMRQDLATSDFNFFIRIHEAYDCIRLSEKMNDFRRYEKYILAEDYYRELEYDINYIYVKQREVNANDMYSFEIVSASEWEDKGHTRYASKYTKYYRIKYNDRTVGRFSCVLTNIIGIYDFEIYEKYRGSHHGTNALRNFLSSTKKPIFIQTWSSNLIAQKCYENAGFIQYEKVFRYIR